MTDPGWTGMWRYALPIPDWFIRRHPTWRAPTELHLMRSRSLVLAVLVPGVGIGAAVYLERYGPVSLSSLKGVVLLFSTSLPMLLGVLLLRDFMKLRFEPGNAITAVYAANRLMAVPHLAAVQLIVATSLVMVFTGWSWLALVGAGLACIGLAYGWPSQQRLQRIESSLRSDGFTGNLIALLLEPRPPEV